MPKGNIADENRKRVRTRLNEYGLTERQMEYWRAIYAFWMANHCPPTALELYAILGVSMKSHGFIMRYACQKLAAAGVLRALPRKTRRMLLIKAPPGESWLRVRPGKGSVIITAPYGDVELTVAEAKEFTDALDDAIWKAEHPTEEVQ